VFLGGVGGNVSSDACSTLLVSQDGNVLNALPKARQGRAEADLRSIWTAAIRVDAVIQDSLTRRRWGLLYAAIIPDTANGSDHVEPASPPRTQREEFFLGDTVGFCDKHLREQVGIIVKLNAKAASIAVNDSNSHWRVYHA
jgi:hypothetical protein